jgi:hypothetical protein
VPKALKQCLNPDPNFKAEDLQRRLHPHQAVAEAPPFGDNPIKHSDVSRVETGGQSRRKPGGFCHNDLRTRDHGDERRQSGTVVIGERLHSSPLARSHLTMALAPCSIALLSTASEKDRLRLPTLAAETGRRLAAIRQSRGSGCDRGHVAVIEGPPNPSQFRPKSREIFFLPDCQHGSILLYFQANSNVQSAV